MNRLLSRAASLLRPPTSASQRRLFVVGTQKSGTTWLRDCLHSFVPFCTPEWYYPELVEQISTHVSTYGQSLPDNERKATIRAASCTAWSSLVGDYLGEKSAYPCSNVFGTMRPDLHPFAIRMLKSDFPDARTVVIVRDPRAVFNSLSHYLDHFREGWSREIDPCVFAANWAAQNLQWVRDKPDSVVFHEALKKDFENTLVKTLNELGIGHNPEKLRSVRNAVYSVDDLRPKQPEIYRTGTTDEWIQKVDPVVAQQIAYIASDAMVELRLNNVK